MHGHYSEKWRKDALEHVKEKYGLHPFEVQVVTQSNVPKHIVKELEEIYDKNILACHVHNPMLYSGKPYHEIVFDTHIVMINKISTGYSYALKNGAWLKEYASMKRMKSSIKAKSANSF